MKKHTWANLIFTLVFSTLFIPLCYLLIQHLMEYKVPHVSAKESYNSHITAKSPVIRDFSNGKAAAQVPVLMYHQIIPERKLGPQHYKEDGSLLDVVVTMEQFIRQMDHLQNEGYTTLSLEEFEGFLKKGETVPYKSVLITFDDGYKNVFEFAYPVLKERNFQAVQFLITSMISSEKELYDPLLQQYASIPELMEAADVFDYQSHSHAFHKRDGTDTAYLNAFGRSEVKEDLEQAAAWLGTRKAFAAPYGEYNGSTLDVLKEIGISMAFTIEPGTISPGQDPLTLPRHGIFPSYPMSVFKNIVEMKAD
ncbi:polysaccharide deacetylase family protein [Sporosarcina trichiuri]|uniref:polysaccharide deacetylase family protein n=1 Tax=Sporosarcina trichiuri TaxID=3056445 RepID=UPI0025B58DCF|nr:polysaccharide deacetylase family protein [Sporosarcina sp. 0.2-SM1T-5]WJY28073.1 polysaccharide deacetylase family protein [Sporosarcina sp. 0.2-SM1T-5]